jgi:Meckel syndrome type 1 protein
MDTPLVAAPAPLAGPAAAPEASGKAGVFALLLQAATTGTGTEATPAAPEEAPAPEAAAATPVDASTIAGLVWIAAATPAAQPAVQPAVQPDAPANAPTAIGTEARQGVATPPAPQAAITIPPGTDAPASPPPAAAETDVAAAAATPAMPAPALATPAVPVPQAMTPAAPEAAEAAALPALAAVAAGPAMKPPAAPAARAGKAEPQQATTEADAPADADSTIPAAVPATAAKPAAAPETAAAATPIRRLAEVEAAAPRAARKEASETAPAAPLTTDPAAAPRAPEAAATAEAPRAAPPALPVRQLAPMAVALAFAVRDGESSSLSVALDPGELGRVEVSVERQSGHTAVRVTAERPETLMLLQRDQRELDRALTQAGIASEGRSLDFSLSGQNAGGQRQQGSPSWAGFAAIGAGSRAAATVEPAPRLALSLLDIAV